MGQVDEFLRAHVTTGLFANEQIVGFGHARQPQRFNAFGVPQLYSHWLCVATSVRLILFRTEATGIFGGAPALSAGEALVWFYDEIARVETGNVEGLNIHSGGQAIWFRLIPHPLSGPGTGEAIRYDLYPAADGLDDQRRFMSTFPGSLAQQVAAGAFPMNPEKRAALQVRLAQQHAVDAARSEAAFAHAAHQREAIKRAAVELGGTNEHGADLPKEAAPFSTTQSAAHSRRSRRRALSSGSARA